MILPRIWFGKVSLSMWEVLLLLLLLLLLSLGLLVLRPSISSLLQSATTCFIVKWDGLLFQSATAFLLQSATGITKCDRTGRRFFGCKKAGQTQQTDSTKDNIRSRVTSTLQSASLPNSNLTPDEQKALKRLETDENIVILPGDCCNGQDRLQWQNGHPC